MEARKSRHTKSKKKRTRPKREPFGPYFELAKSGIVILVLISVIGGYLIGHPFERSLDVARLLFTLLGIGLLASGSSALNQIQERKEDASMPRTQNRPLPSGRLSLKAAMVFVVTGLTGGLGVLYWLDLQLFLLGVSAVILYNGLYTLWWKRRWPFAAVPGAIPGALPILMGHTSATGEIWTQGGLYLFFILFFWQMPHFWVLALRFRKDYVKGGFPTLPAALGSKRTVYYIVLWSLGYFGLAFIAPFFIQVGPVYLIPTVVISVKVLWELASFVKEAEKRWIHFFLWVNLSLIVLITSAVIDLWSIYLLIPYLTR